MRIWPLLVQTSDAQSSNTIQFTIKSVVEHILLVTLNVAEKPCVLSETQKTKETKSTCNNRLRNIYRCSSDHSRLVWVGLREICLGQEVFHLRLPSVQWETRTADETFMFTQHSPLFSTRFSRFTDRGIKRLFIPIQLSFPVFYLNPVMSSAYISTFNQRRLDLFQVRMKTLEFLMTRFIWQLFSRKQYSPLASRRNCQHAYMLLGNLSKKMFQCRVLNITHRYISCQADMFSEVRLVN